MSFSSAHTTVTMHVLCARMETCATAWVFHAEADLHVDEVVLCQQYLEVASGALHLCQLRVAAMPFQLHVHNLLSLNLECTHHQLTGATVTVVGIS